MYLLVQQIIELYLQLVKLKVRKVYSYEPGKTSPLPPIPTTGGLDKDSKDDETDLKDKYEELDNPNEFKSSPSQEKRSSQNIEEKKLLSDVIDGEEEKKMESDINLEGLNPPLASLTFMFLYNLLLSDRREYYCESDNCISILLTLTYLTDNPLLPLSFFSSHVTTQCLRPAMLHCKI